MDKPIVFVTAFHNHIIIDVPNPAKVEKVFYPVGAGRIGSVLIDTQKHLGVSEEALELMKKLHNCNDDVGDLDSWELISDEASGSKPTGVYCFAWLGLINGAKGLDSETSRTFNADTLPHQRIPNDVPKWAKDAYERYQGEDDVSNRQ